MVYELNLMTLSNFHQFITFVLEYLTLSLISFLKLYEVKTEMG